jgi:peptide/nickel transport system substrate-binding protein
MRHFAYKLAIFCVLSILIVSVLLMGCGKATEPTTNAPIPAQTTTSAPAQTSTSAPVKTTTTATATAPAQTTTSAPAQTTTSGIQPQYGGILKIILASGIAAHGTPSEAGLGGLYALTAVPENEVLLRHDNKFQLFPRLAESWDVSPDGKAITLHLKKDVKFQDGTKFNAAAVQYNLEHYAPQNVVPSYLKTITSFNIIDEYTLRLNLSAFNLNLLFNLTMGPGFMTSPTAAEKATTPEKMAVDHQVGTGAFDLVSVQRDVKLVYQKANNYRETGKPYLDGIEFSQISDPVTAVMALTSGNGHILYKITPQQASELKAAGFNIVQENLNPIGYITPDGGNADSPFSIKKVREATEYALDKIALAKGIGMGYYPALTQFAVPGEAVYNEGLKSRNYDPQKAKQLLAEAGFPNGFNTRILALNTSDKDILVSLQSYLKEVGIKANLELMDRALFTKTIHEGWKNGIVVNPFPMNVGLVTKIEMFFSEDLKAGTTVIAGAYHPAGWQEKLQAALSQVDDTKRISQTKELCRIMYEEVMGIPLWASPEITAISPKVHDISWATGHGYFWEPQNAWLSK